jgi:GT2 family glycosyltransferase
VLCFLHDDVEVLSDRWLEELLGVLLLPGVGAAGATLLAPGGAVRHAGYRLGPDGSILDATRGLDRLDTGYFGQAGLARCVTAASSAALLVRRSVYQAVGGHWPGEPPDARAADDRAADVEFGRRLGVAGWRCAVTPHAELVHHECDAVAAGPPARATGWAGEDPSSNPNLALDGRSPAWPPRPSRR